MKRSLQQIVKNVKSGVAKTLLGLSLIVTPISFDSCTYKSSDPQGIINIRNYPPDTYITKKFKEKTGEVEYCFYSDLEDFTDHIEIQINDGIYQNVDSSSCVTVPLIEGVNQAKARSCDISGEKDESPAIEWYISPTELEAHNYIRNYLNQKSGTYDEYFENVKMSLGASEDFYVDFLIRRNDGKDAVINYVSHGDSLTEEEANQDLLNLYGIPNNYWTLTPETESSYKSFIDGGFE